MLSSVDIDKFKAKAKLQDRYAKQLNRWSSQDLVETSSPRPVSSFELLRTHTG